MSRTNEGRRPQPWGYALAMLALLLMATAPTTASWAQKRTGKDARPSKRGNNKPRRGVAEPKQSELADPGASRDSADTNARAKVRKGAKDKTQVFDFSQLNFSGSERKPQLLYFLDRAQEELERASLERRSFMPELVRSVEEGQL